MSNFYQLGFQDGVSSLIESLINFNDHLIFIAVLILVFIFYMLVNILKINLINLKFFESHTLEFI
jgi:hypothetical protein